MKMKLSQLLQTKNVKIPNYEWLEVTIVSSLTMWQMNNIQKKYPHLADWNIEDQMLAWNEILITSIVDWNLEDDNWNKLLVNEDNIVKLPQDVVLYLMWEITPEKKN